MVLFTSLDALDIDVSEYGEYEDEMSSLKDDICDGIRMELDEKYPDTRFSLNVAALGVTKEGREKVLDLAATWNQRIQSKLEEAMAKTQEHIANGSFSLDSNITYDMCLAARLADDNFYPFGAMGIFGPSTYGSGYFMTVMKDEMKADILARPEQYAIINVCAI